MNDFDWESKTYTCGRQHCPCPHSEPCDRGWVPGNDGVLPCVACKPELAVIFSTAKSNYERNARMLARGLKRD